MRKRALSILLILVLALSVLPAGAFAAPHNVDIDEVNFPDPVFRQYVLDNLDTKIKDGILNAFELNAATWVNVSGLGVKDLRGIEHLYALTALDCSNNSLTALDVSKNTELKELYCFTNAIKSLDVRKNTELQTLRCQSNKLTSLDLSKNTKLSYLNFAVNEISSVDLSKNTALTALQCGSNKLTSLDLSKNTALSAVECSSNKLTALDLSHCPALEMVNCCGNSIKTLDLRGCKAFSKALRDTANVEYHPFTNACYIANNASGSYLADGLCHGHPAGEQRHAQDHRPAQKREGGQREKGGLLREGNGEGPDLSVAQPEKGRRGVQKSRDKSVADRGRQARPERSEVPLPGPEQRLDPLQQCGEADGGLQAEDHRPDRIRLREARQQGHLQGEGHRRRSQIPVVLHEARRQQMGQDRQGHEGVLDGQGEQKSERVQIPLPGIQRGREGVFQGSQTDGEIAAGGPWEPPGKIRIHPQNFIEKIVKSPLTPKGDFGILSERLSQGRAHYAVKREIASNTVVTSVEYVRRSGG